MAEKEKKTYDYKLVIVGTFLLLVILQIIIPEIISGVPIVGPYMRAVVTLYSTGADIITGNIGFATIPVFLLSAFLVVLPPILIALAFYIYKSTKGLLKFLIPLAILIALVIVFWRIILVLAP